MATGGADPLFVDTNVLVYAAVAEAPLHDLARRTLANAAAGGTKFWISRQVLREFIATLTRPQGFSAPLSVSVLVSLVRDLQQRMDVADETTGVTQHLLSLLQQVSTGGKQVHDANIVATMQVHGIQRLLTANPSDFARFAHLIVVESLDERPRDR
jgi:predicted nucleic acid-binding protein